MSPGTSSCWTSCCRTGMASRCVASCVVLRVKTPIIMLTAKTQEAEKILGPRSRCGRLRDEAVQPGRAACAHQGASCAASMMRRVSARADLASARSTSIAPRSAAEGSRRMSRRWSCACWRRSFDPADASSPRAADSTGVGRGDLHRRPRGRHAHSQPAEEDRDHAGARRSS